MLVFLDDAADAVVVGSMKQVGDVSIASQPARERELRHLPMMRGHASQAGVAVLQPLRVRSRTCLEFREEVAFDRVLEIEVKGVSVFTAY